MHIDMRLFALILSIAIVMYVHQLRNNGAIKEGLDSCVENVQTQCGPVIEYASLLEHENEKVRKKLKLCIQK